MGWLEEVVDYVNQKGQGLGMDAYDYLNDPENAEELRTVLENTYGPEVVGNIRGNERLFSEARNIQTGGVRPDTIEGMRRYVEPTGRPITGARPVMDSGPISQNRSWSAPKGGMSAPGNWVTAAALTAAGAIPPIWNWASDKINEPPPKSYPDTTSAIDVEGGSSTAPPSPIPAEYELPATQVSAPSAYGTPGMESQMLGENPDLQFKKGETLAQYKTRIGLGDRGATEEEIAKAWQSSGSLARLNTNENMFTRDTSANKLTPEEDRVKKAEEMMLRAKKAATNVLGYDPDEIDPEREALGNTYRFFQGKYYSPQQYNDAYAYYYKQALQKKKDGASAVQHVMDRIVADVGTSQTREEMRKAQLEQRKKEHEDDMLNKEEKLEEKRRMGAKENTSAIIKALDRAFSQYAKPDETTNNVDPNKIYYNIPPEMQKQYSNAQAKAERYMKSEGMSSGEAVQKALSEITASVIPERTERIRGFINRRYPNFEKLNDSLKQEVLKKLRGWGYADSEISSAIERGTPPPQKKRPLADFMK